MDTPARPGGLLTSARGLFATALALLQVRLELFVTEVREEQLRLGSFLGYAAAAIFFLGFGAVFVALFITVLLWDSHRLLALGIFAAVFLVCGVAAALVALRSIQQGSRLFAASLAELDEDRQALRRAAEDEE